jgi:hypothetical protein
MFNRWRCITHECGSYNFNTLLRHEINSCNIVIERTCGIIKPKTFGGYNGDLSRGYIPEYREQIREKEIERSQMNKWIDYTIKKRREFANKHKRLLLYQRTRYKNKQGVT